MSEKACFIEPNGSFFYAPTFTNIQSTQYN
jgi:hypothetical protein